MYTINQVDTNVFMCRCRFQDGTERWTEKSLKQAIKSMIVAAKEINHEDINADRIRIKLL